MKESRSLIGIISLVIVGIVGVFYFTAPIPETFILTEDPIHLNVNEKKTFLDMFQLYPDASYNSFTCVCEDSSIAQVDGKSEIIGLKSGTTTLTCKARFKTLASVSVIVE